MGAVTRMDKYGLRIRRPQGTAVRSGVDFNSPPLGRIERQEQKSAVRDSGNVGIRRQCMYRDGEPLLIGRKGESAHLVDETGRERRERRVGVGLINGDEVGRRRRGQNQTGDGKDGYRNPMHRKYPCCQLKWFGNTREYRRAGILKRV